MVGDGWWLSLDLERSRSAGSYPDVRGAAGAGDARRPRSDSIRDATSGAAIFPFFEDYATWTGVKGTRSANAEILMRAWCC